MSFAASPGTAVDPTWSRARMSPAAAARRRAMSRAACAGQSGLAGASTGPPVRGARRCRLRFTANGASRNFQSRSTASRSSSLAPELSRTTSAAASRSALRGLRGHPGPGVRGGHVPVLHHALHPDVVRGVHHHHQVEVGALAGLDEQRDVLDHDRAFRSGGGQRGGALPDEGMDDAVEHREAFRVAEDEGAELRPVQAAVGRQDGLAEGRDHLRESRGSRFHHLPGQGIGVDHHGPEFAQACGGH